MRISLGRLHLAVTQQAANDLERGAARDQKRCESVAQIMDAHIRQISLPLDLEPEAADFADGFSDGVAGKQPWVATRQHQLALAHNRDHILRDRDAVDLALLGGRGRLDQIA